MMDSAEYWAIVNAIQWERRLIRAVLCGSKRRQPDVEGLAYRLAKLSPDSEGEQYQVPPKRARCSGASTQGGHSVYTASGR
jgi:hypothetical protein